MTRINRLDADIERSRELRSEALQQLRAALFVDADQASIFPDAQVVALARLHFRRRSSLETALRDEDWAEISRQALFIGELLAGLQTLDLANTPAPLNKH